MGFVVTKNECDISMSRFGEKGDRMSHTENLKIRNPDEIGCEEER
jgi:hypothetical protein